MLFRFMLKNSYLNFMRTCLLLDLFLGLVLQVALVQLPTAHAAVNGKGPAANSYDDNEFAEFEEMDDEESLAHKRTGPDLGGGGGPSSDAPSDRPPASPPTSPPQKGSQASSQEEDMETVVEDEDDDDEMFEDTRIVDEDDVPSPKDPQGGKPDLKIAKIPIHLRSSWDTYYLEMIAIGALIIYFINFIAGKSKNQSLASSWLEANRPLLEANFALVGDDGKKVIENNDFLKETESMYILWCSGRVSVEGMLIELRFKKRHDLVSLLFYLLRPTGDQITIKANLTPDAMDTFVFCLANRKTAAKLAREMNDIATYCPERKSVDKYGLDSDSFALMSEIGEVASNMLGDSKISSILKQYHKCIEYIHISDQYSGPKELEEPQPLKKPQVRRIFKCSFKFPDSRNFSGSISNEEELIEATKPLMQLVFLMLDKVRKMKLSREAKTKAEKNRQKVEEIYLKATHAQRQELAQMKREERKRLEKERILNEEDPEKQRRWEEREYKKELKKKSLKMKQLKVKAM